MWKRYIYSEYVFEVLFKIINEIVINSKIKAIKIGGYFPYIKWKYKIK